MTARSGPALLAELERRFVVTDEVVTLAGRSVTITRPRDPEALISEDDFARDERLPYWADVWPSSKVLGDRVAAHDGAGRRLLELGCGVGVVTTGALRAGFDVLATDYYEDALLFTRANAARAVGREPHTRMVDWRDFPRDLGSFDRVVAADVLYERPYAALVAGAIASALAHDGEALVADPGRIAAAAFVDECAARGLRLVAREGVPYAAGTIRQTITLYALCRS